MNQLLKALSLRGRRRGPRRPGMPSIVAQGQRRSDTWVAVLTDPARDADEAFAIERVVQYPARTWGA